MDNNSKITVALASCLLLAPAVLAGAWFSGCKVTTWNKWDQNTGFNNNQKKDNRDIKDNISDKIYEYKEYRNNECKLDNGYVPPIINGIIN